MKFEPKQILFVSLILVFALAIRLVKNYLSSTLTLEITILSVLALPVILVIYFALSEITKDKYSALFALAIAAVMPFEAEGYLWALSIIFFTLTLYAAVIMRRTQKNWLIFLIFPLLAAVLHYSAIFLAPIFIIYLILLAVEHDTLRKQEVIYIALTSIFSLIIVLSFNGLPKGVMTGVGVLTLFALVGSRPVVFGVLGAYYGVMKNISNSLILVSSAGVIFLLIFFKFLPTAIGIPYLFISLAGLGGVFFRETMKIVKISRFRKFSHLIILGLFAFILITGLVHWI